MSSIFDWLNVLVNNYGYFIIPLATFLESTLIIGLVSPGLLVLLFAGYYSGTGMMQIHWVIVLGLIGVLLGDNASFTLGKYASNKLNKRMRTEELLNSISPRWRKGSSWLLPFFHFSGYARAFVPFALGILKMSFFKWIKYDICGAILWTVVITLIGYFSGRNENSINDIIRETNLIEWIFSVLLLLWLITSAIAIRKIYKLFKKPKISDE